MLMRCTSVIILCFFPLLLWGQGMPIPGNTVERAPAHTHHHDRPINFGIKGGFTSSLFLVSKLALNNIGVDEVQNNYKLGYFGSLFMRINFKKHFLQPEISYTINRCDITFVKPPVEGANAGIASIASSIHSIDVPIIYGYNIIKEGPYGMAIFGGPKLRYVLNGQSKVDFDNFDHPGIKEELNPLNLSVTLGVAVTISRIFFDFRYDIGLHNISRQVTYDAPAATDDKPMPADELRFNRRDNVLSFSLGVFF
ncbi:MAG: PorT family protein [Prevotellaceae bacterium]|jgi:hypothetical protein|nr:PorT family protein [Prevotellaceae bacterium]